MKINKEAEELRQREDEIKNKLVAYILDQPQNPDIEPVKNSSIKAFTIRSSDIFSNNLIMSPFYYDWKQQAAFIAELVTNGRSLYSSLDQLKKIATTGRLRVRNNTYVFHPEVCKRLLNILS